MTLRLLGLMSVTLLLSLAAFGLLLGHYQDEVMQEVARTASVVGQETLRTFDFRTGSSPATPNEFFVWHSGQEHESLSADGGPDEAALVDLMRKLREEESPPHERRVVSLRRFGAGHVPEEIQVTCELDGETAEETCRALRGPADGAMNPFFVAIDGVKAETDTRQGLVVLRFPKLDVAAKTSEATSPPQHREIRVRAQAGPAWVGEDAAIEEIKLPIPVGDYQQLFDRFQSRSLYLFLGVFLVGTVLSAGLASRFTRPIRRLDDGIRRIAEGDLDARVVVRGKDEMARLGRAFNQMTERLRASQARAKELMRREKHSALGRLVAGVAHDVRNPLHSIGLTLDHLAETGRPETGVRAAEFDRSVGIIRGEIRRLDQLVANFLSFATSERRAQDTVDLRELLRETARLVRKEAEWRGVEVTLIVDETAPPIRANGESIRSSILNLILNAFEAMPDGGHLALTLKTRGSELLVEVRDDGSGIPAKDRERVFDFAYTSKESGSGLGLPMVHQCVVEEHGGRVLLESELGQGTLVRLALPIRLDAETPGE